MSQDHVVGITILAWGRRRCHREAAFWSFQSERDIHGSKKVVYTVSCKTGERCSVSISSSRPDTPELLGRREQEPGVLETQREREKKKGKQTQVRRKKSK